MSPSLDEIYGPIRRELDAVEDAMARALADCAPELRQVVGHAGRYRGKLLRPALLLVCGHAGGGTTERHIGAAATVELIHTATLVHDDVIDEAGERRHAATVNARWGPEVSILLGDLLFARALELFASLASLGEHHILAGAIREVCEGELLQLLSRRGAGLAEEAYLHIIGKKTGALCGAACSLGATMAGRDDAAPRFAAFGRCLGVAFQITDDCLDIRGDEQAAGKTLGLDAFAGKLTLPTICVRDRGSEATRRRLDELLAAIGKGDGPACLAAFLAENGAFEYCERAAQRFIEQGAAQIAGLADPADSDALLALASFAVHRQR